MRAGRTERVIANRPRGNLDGSPLREALAHVDELKRQLASSRQECFAARQRLDFLTNADAHVRGYVDPHKPATAGDPAGRAPLRFLDSCLAAGLDLDAADGIRNLLGRRVRYRKGDVIYRAGSAFRDLYAICAGSCKTVVITEQGDDLVSGYHLVGEVVGLDGICDGRYACGASALEDMQACSLPFDQVESLARFNGHLGRALHALLSREGARARDMKIVLGTMRAEVRVAVFLLDLSRRYAELGYSPNEFVLRLTREEIASYLGLQLETVSRAFSRFRRDGLVWVDGRAVKLLDLAELGALADRPG